MNKKITLAGSVILKNNSILLLHRTEKDWWELPGGGIEVGETPQQAAVRELKEELLIDVEIVKKLGEMDFLHKGEMLGYIWFLANIKGNQEPKVGEPEEFLECQFIILEDLANHNLSPNMQNLINTIDLNKV